MPIAERLPLFLYQFFNRSDIVLVGFGLGEDERLLGDLLASRAMQLSASSSSISFRPKVPYMLDLATLFTTTVAAPSGSSFSSVVLKPRREGEEEVEEEAPPTLPAVPPSFENNDADGEGVPDVVAEIPPPVSALSGASASAIPAQTSPQPTTTRPRPLDLVTTGTQPVGTVQSSARLFQQRFRKPKGTSVSNWAIHSTRQTTEQVIYAARDVVYPVFVLGKLLREYADWKDAELRSLEERTPDATVPESGNGRNNMRGQSS